MYGPEHCVTFRISASTPVECFVAFLQALAEESSRNGIDVEATIATGHDRYPPSLDLLSAMEGDDLAIPHGRDAWSSPFASGDALVRLNVETGASHIAAQIVEHFPSNLRSLAVRATATTLRRLFGSCKLGRHVKVATLVFDADTPDQIDDAINAVRSCGGIVEIEVSGPVRATDASRWSLLVWRTIDSTEEFPYRTVVPDLEVNPDGTVSTGGKRSSNRVWDAGLDGALAELGLDWSATRLSHGGLLLPGTVRMPEPDGPGALTYFVCGTQAFAMAFEEDLARAAFGFFSAEREQFREWAQWVSRRSEGQGLVMPIVFSDLFYGVQSDEVLLAPRTANRRHPAFQLAAWIVQGISVTSNLGLLDGSAWSDMRPVRPDHPGSRGYYEKVSALLALSVEVIVFSRISIGKRQLAARALTTLGTHDAKRSAKRLATEVPDVGLAVVKRFRQRGPMKRLKESKDPHLLRRYISEALDELRAVFTKEEVQHDG